MPTCSIPRTMFCLALLLSAGGCAATDPYQRIGQWRPNGANDTNLLRMVAVPSDLVTGEGDSDGDGRQAVAALDRLRADKVKPLLDSGVAQITISSPSPAATGGQ